MSILKKLSDSFLGFDFKLHYKKASTPRGKIRLLGCHHIQGGKGYDEVASILLVNRKTIMFWVENFESGGLDGLLSDASGRGKKAKIIDSQQEEFCNHIIELQEKRNGGRIKGEDICSMIEEKFNVSYSLSGTYKCLKRLGMSWVSARSIHPKTDLEAQKSFKKTLPKL